MEGRTSAWRWRPPLNESIEEYDAVIRGEDSADPVARRHVKEALQEKAVALGKLGRYEARVAVWDALIARQAEEPDEVDPLFEDRLLVNKAIDLRRSGRDQEAIDTLVDVRDADGRPGEELPRRLVGVRLWR